APTQDAILTGLDDRRDPFFNALVEHTMEGVYGHPVYGGNRNFRAWKAFGYQGDVHGVRFPGIGPPDAPWNRYGGYAPEEMGKRLPRLREGAGEGPRAVADALLRVPPAVHRLLEDPEEGRAPRLLRPWPRVLPPRFLQLDVHRRSHRPQPEHEELHERQAARP